MNPLTWSWGFQGCLWTILGEPLFWKNWMRSWSVSRLFPPRGLQSDVTQSLSGRLVARDSGSIISTSSKVIAEDLFLSYLLISLLTYMPLSSDSQYSMFYILLLNLLKYLCPTIIKSNHVYSHPMHIYLYS